MIVYLLTILLMLYIIHHRPGRGYTPITATWDPPKLVQDVLTQEECAAIIEKALPKFTRSTVVGTDVPSDTRTSDTAWIPKSDPHARKVLERACELAGKTIDYCEDLQIVRYTPGTYYKEHHDSCCDDSTHCSLFEKRSGQRVATLLVYLNNDFTDGETFFPTLNEKMKADTGSGIFFRPMGKDDARCHPKALHAGLPVGSGVKYACNAWIREKPIQ